MSFSEKLKKLRMQSNKRQSEVAMHLSVSQSTYAKYESGYLEPNIQTIANLAQFFGVTIDFLLSNDSPKSDFLDLGDALQNYQLMFKGKPVNNEIKQEIIDMIEYQFYKESKTKQQKKKSDLLEYVPDERSE